LSLDAKLPQTLRSLLWPPGELTLEWLRGRRARYVAPMRLYLATAFVFFVAWPYTPFRTALDAFLEGYVAGYEEGSAKSLDSLQVFGDVAPMQVAAGTITDRLPALFLILLVPASGVLLFVVNRGSWRLVGNFIAALHLHAVMFLFFIAIASFDRLFRGGWVWEDAVVPILMLALIGHLASAVARVNEVGFVRATGRVLTVLVLYLLIGTLMLAAVVGPPATGR